MENNLNKFLNDSQDPQAVEKTLNKVTGLLTSKEEIEYIAVQKKPALNLSPGSTVLTNKRIIFCRPSTFGLSMNFQDFLWKDVSDCHMKEEMLGAEFSVKLINSGVYSMDYLPKSQARMLYRFAQEKEEEMAEFRRQRELENSRARAGGGIVVNTQKENSKESMQTYDPIENLKKLKKLLEAELISQEEFDNKKAEILAKL